MSTTTYNGWTNYPTPTGADRGGTGRGLSAWATHRWLTNDEGSQNHWEHMARQAARLQYPALSLAATLKADLEVEASEILRNGLFADLLGWAIDMINFREIAQAFLEDADPDNVGDIEESEDDEESETLQEVS